MKTKQIKDNPRLLCLGEFIEVTRLKHNPDEFRYERNGWYVDEGLVMQAQKNNDLLELSREIVRIFNQ